MLTFANIGESALSTVSHVFGEMRKSESRLDVAKELQTLLKHSLWPGALLVVLIILELDMMIMLASWAMVMFIFKRIRKGETAIFDKIGKDLYKSKTFLVKVIALLLTLAGSKILLETVQLTTPVLFGEELHGIVKIVTKIIIKWLAFLQYFSFYQVYLYAFSALGYYVNGVNKNKMETAKEFEANEKKSS